MKIEAGEPPPVVPQPKYIKVYLESSNILDFTLGI